MPRTWIIVGYDGNNNFIRCARGIRVEDIADHCALTADANGWDINAVIEIGSDNPITGLDGNFVDFAAIEDF